MATYSNNTTIKIGTTVSYYQNVFGGASASQSYTVPANSYLKVIRVACGETNGSASISVTFPGQPAELFNVPSTFEYVPDSTPPGQVGNNPYDILFPSGTVISMNASSSAIGNAFYKFLGQLYQNTP